MDFDEESFDFEYEFDHSIDITNILQEWKDHHKLIIKWSKIAAKAKEELKIAEQRYKVTRATIEREVRDNPVLFGIKTAEGKVPTEAVIQAAVRTDDRYMNASLEWAEAIRNEAILSDARDTFKYGRLKMLQAVTDISMSTARAQNFRCGEDPHAVANSLNDQLQETIGG